MKIAFNRREFSGALGDLGTILPISIGLILVNGLNPAGLFFSVGLFYIFTGLYYRVTVPVQPMKVIGAYSIATAMSAEQVLAASVLMGAFLFILALTGAIDLIGKNIPKPVIRGVQLSTGVLLMAKGFKMMAGTSGIQALSSLAEPYLKVQSVGPVPIGILIGIAGAVITLLLLDNRKLPAGLVVVLLGLLAGLLMGTREGLDALSPGFYFPEWLPLGLPVPADYTLTLLVLVLPQLPMTVGNAVIANADLSKQYFGDDSKKVSYRGLCVSMALGCFLSFLFGGMPLCHGAGGLAAHYRFGARTAGSNLMIGGVFVFLVLILGSGIMAVIYLLPMAVLGVLLVFAGSQLALTVQDTLKRRELFVVMMILGVTLASNLGFGVLAGLFLSILFKYRKIDI